MVLFNITNVPGFLKRVSACKGAVYSANVRHQGQDLRPLAENLLSSGLADSLGTIESLNVTLERSDDARRLLRYMAEAAIEQRGLPA